MSTPIKILDHQQIIRKIDRIAWQIYEHFAESNELTIAGIEGNGLEFAKLITEKLNSISDIKLTSASIMLNKANPETEPILISINENEIKNKPIILVDDVLNTGKTMMYSIAKILELHPSKLQVAVVVDRDHKLFPIKADFVGLSLSTNMQEHITVDFSDLNYGVFLS